MAIPSRPDNIYDPKSKIWLFIEHGPAAEIRACIRRLRLRNAAISTQRNKARIAAHFDAANKAGIVLNFGNYLPGAIPGRSIGQVYRFFNTP